MWFLLFCSLRIFVIIGIYAFIVVELLLWVDGLRFKISGLNMFGDKLCGFGCIVLIFVDVISLGLVCGCVIRFVLKVGDGV